MSDIKKVVLAYSGGLDTSVILKWLIETYDCEVTRDPSGKIMCPVPVPECLYDQQEDVLSSIKQDQLEKGGKTISEDEINHIRQPILEKYKQEGSHY